MYRRTQFLIGLIAVLLVCFIAAAVPWTSRTSVEIRVTEEDGGPMRGVKATFFDGAGIVIGEGITDEKGFVRVTIPTRWNSDWGKQVKRVEVIIDGFVTQKSTLKNTEEHAGSISGWLPFDPPLAPKPHMLYRIQAQLVCRRIR